MLFKSRDQTLIKIKFELDKNYRKWVKFKQAVASISLFLAYKLYKWSRVKMIVGLGC